MDVRRRMPPLNAVRAFEAAARHGGFVAAADELAVTASAVSQQVKGLEAWLGRPLFNRLAQGLELTPIGRQYFQPLTDALDRIDVATRAVMPTPASRTLAVTSLASFVAEWLAPRLPKFAQAHPEIDLRLSTTDRIVDLAADGFDVALRHGYGDYPGLESEFLTAETLSPVCSPALAEKITCIEDLAKQVLMHDVTAGVLTPLTWQGWLRTVGREDLIPRFPLDRGPGFSDSQFLVQSAIAGNGIMLGRSMLVADSIRNGTLVAPLGFHCRSPYKYYFVTLPGGKSEPKAAAFREWLIDEMAPYREGDDES